MNDKYLWFEKTLNFKSYWQIFYPTKFLTAEKWYWEVIHTLELAEGQPP